MPRALKRILNRHPLYPQFIEWLHENSKNELREATFLNYTHQMELMRSKYHLDLEHPDIRSLFMSMEVECGAATLNLRRYVLKRWLKFRGIKVNDEISQLLRRKSGRRTTQVTSGDLLTREELLDILAHTRSPSVRAYLAVLYDSGSRPSALTRVQMRDITEDRYGFTVRIRDDKTEHSQRSIRLLDPLSMTHLRQWLAIHPHRLNGGSHVFLNNRGHPFNPVAVLNQLKQHEERLGRGHGQSKGRLNLYLFRKTAATRLLRERKLSEMEIKSRLGHKRHSMMLEKYYAILNEEDQCEAELRALGVSKSEQREPDPIVCPNCSAVNTHDAMRCSRCHIPLTESAQIEELESVRESLTKDFEERLRTLEKLLQIERTMTGIEPELMQKGHFVTVTEKQLAEIESLEE